jgi:SAM-dependent methyltransferase
MKKELIYKVLKKNPTLYKLLYNSWTFLKNTYKKIEYSKYNNYPGLKGRISYNDTMFAGDIKHYMEVGESAIENIENVLKQANKTFDSLKSILDMPSGHGRVLRLLATKVSPEKITACDIDVDGIEFCEKEFGCRKLLSSNDFSKIRFSEDYSLIWVGSLFTHLNKAAFASLLKLLFNSLEIDGILVFTAHGKYSVEIFERYWTSQSIPISSEQLQKELIKTNGFYYAPYYNTQDYGISISLKHYVIPLIESLFEGRAKLITYKEKGWDNHQDVFAIQKLR